MLLRHFIGKAIAKVQRCRMNALAHCAWLAAIRRAAAALTVTTSKPSPSISRIISTPASCRSGTISASATLPAEISRSQDCSSATTQASACGSPSRTAISPEVSTAITSANRCHHTGSPDCVPHLPPPWLLPRHSPAPPATAHVWLWHLAAVGSSPALPPPTHDGSAQLLPPFRHGAPVRSTGLWHR